MKTGKKNGQENSECIKPRVPQIAKTPALPIGNPQIVE